ncbi:nucleotidyltransferase domain-containing protein [archaeon]|nr:nucleotidyltransferase domain-containing protein [archaeon]
MKSKNLLKAFASSFVSFLIEKIDLARINKIVLFGSVARDEATKTSDIDLFIDSTDAKIKKDIPEIVNAFYESMIYKDYWAPLGVKNEIKCITGNLEKWKLKRSIISEGIILYGKTSGKIKGKLFCLFKINVTGKVKEKLKIWRALFGYKQKTKGKTYNFKGMIGLCDGKKLSPGVFIVPMAKSQNIIKFLREHKVKHQLIEFSTDMF